MKNESKLKKKDTIIKNEYHREKWKTDIQYFEFSR